MIQSHDTVDILVMAAILKSPTAQVIIIIIIMVLFVLQYECGITQYLTRRTVH